MIEDAEWSVMTIRDKLEHYIQTTSLAEDECQDYAERFDFWSDILGVSFGGYNSAVDDDVIDVMNRMSVSKFFAENTHEELIAYILCNAGLAEYGTSPRGAWIDHDLRDLIPSVIERWRRDWPQTENPDSAHHK